MQIGLLKRRNQSMSKTKVYLSKSNESNPTEVALIKKILQDKFDIELVEYTGGTYTNLPLRKCDKLIIIPPQLCGNSDKALIGAGQMGQIRDFLNVGKDRCDILIVDFVHDAVVTDDDDEYQEAEIHVSEFYDATILDINNYKSGHAMITTNGMGISLINLSGFTYKPVKKTRAPFDLPHTKVGNLNVSEEVLKTLVDYHDKLEDGNRFADEPDFTMTVLRAPDYNRVKPELYLSL